MIFNLGSLCLSTRLGLDNESDEETEFDWREAWGEEAIGSGDVAIGGCGGAGGEGAVGITSACRLYPNNGVNRQRNTHRTTLTSTRCLAFSNLSILLNSGIPLLYNSPKLTSVLYKVSIDEYWGTIGPFVSIFWTLPRADVRRIWNCFLEMAIYSLKGGWGLWVTTVLLQQQKRRARGEQSKGLLGGEEKNPFKPMKWRQYQNNRKKWRFNIKKVLCLYDNRRRSADRYFAYRVAYNHFGLCVSTAYMEKVQVFNMRQVQNGWKGAINQFQHFNITWTQDLHQCCW